MEVVVDRIEEKYAVVEISEGVVCNLSLLLVPGVKEGDVISITINKEETEKRSHEIEELINEVFE